MSFAAALLLAVTPVAQEPAPPAEPAPADARAELAAALAEAVDLPDPQARRRAAAALAKRRGVTVEQWLEAAASFGDFAPAEPGSAVRTVALPVLDGVEETRIHVHVPAGYAPGTPAPLLLLLHGAGGSGEALVPQWRALADELGMLLVAPDDPEAHGGYRFTARERAAALAALRWARRQYDVDEDRVHLFGASRGGHLAWDLATRHPDLWATATAAIGAPTFIVNEGRNNLRLVGNLRDLPLRQLQGMQDDPKLLENLRLAFARLEAEGAADAEWVRFPELGHAFRLDGVDWTEFLARRRDPQRGSMVHYAARPDAARRGPLQVERLRRGEVEEVFPIEVDPRQWDGWGHAEKAAYIQGMADARTARVALDWEPGRVRVAARGVDRVRLLLTAGMLGADGAIAVEGGRRPLARSLKPSKSVLLADFVERFDRRFLPVAELVVPLP